MLKSYKIYTCTNGALGLHLSRAPWDPYPWVSSIQKESTSYQAGVRTGDCLLELNGQDVLGMKISEIAALLKNHWLNESSNHVNVVIWRNKCNSNSNSSNSKNNSNATDVCNNGGDYAADNDDDDDDDDDDENEENNAHNINQQSLQKFATCLQHIAQLLECPVCLEVIKPPGWQCCNGHVLCNNCRSRSEKCPVCRVPLGPRGRCLLSDKLFTLLADSFPCDGVRSNKNSPKDRRKCSPEFHNQPKMAIVGKQQHSSEYTEQQQDKEEQATKKAKDFILTSLRQRHRRKIFTMKLHNEENLNGVETGSKQSEENSYSPMQKQAMFNGSVVVAGSNRKSPVSSADYKNDDDGNMQDVAAIQQCHCVTCYKPDKLAVVNNVDATTTESLNKYILRIPSQGGQCAIEKATAPAIATTAIAKVNYEEKYQKNYQCPTGKLCCLKTVNMNVNVLLSHTKNNNMSAAVAASGATVAINQEQHGVNNHFYKSLTSEWEILAHLTEDHQLPVQQYYGIYGQRIQVHNTIHSNSTLVCLNLRGSDSFDANAEKFFIACIPLDKSGTKMAIFVYHLNTVDSITSTTGTLSNSNADEVSIFETIIENPLTGIKWFGCAHSLTKPWSHILEKQHFLEHHIVNSHGQKQQNYSQVNSARVRDDDSFVFVVKRKLETKT